MAKYTFLPNKECPKCGKDLIWQKHQERWKPKKNQPYYFSMWLRCKDCKFTKHFEKFKKYINYKEENKNGERTD